MVKVLPRKPFLKAHLTFATLWRWEAAGLDTWYRRSAKAALKAVLSALGTGRGLGAGVVGSGGGSVGLEMAKRWWRRLKSLRAWVRTKSGLRNPTSLIPNSLSLIPARSASRAPLYDTWALCKSLLTSG